MPTVHAEALLREFYYHDTPIPDPNPAMSVEQVRDLFTPQYPEIATAKISGPELINGALRYTFRRQSGRRADSTHMRSDDLTSQALNKYFDHYRHRRDRKTNRMVEEHLKCKRSIQLTTLLSQSLGDHTVDRPTLPAPTELLPPLA